MTYIDTAVTPVKTDKKEAYTEVSAMMAQVFKKAGALSVTELWALDAPYGERTSFPRAVELQPDETPVLSMIIWPSKEARDIGMHNAMQDASMQSAFKTGLFDGARMIFASFERIVDV
ncbi:DUF1428 domain-containing protein [Rhodobacteraceae bacterium RKSG542]|uniref:DUF1428 domain-containing protein n=1 Tax=Pseudovibrio flavus TaxID=2529854 RepID=UPI0012BD6792|nr:DUF1428 domain-containing protein [Pseudovibrio flavus]MTI19333.1 DUF1428 domain-containing protein [Pseudovibrio flavus]